MRAREFTINIPINVRLGDHGEPEVTAPTATNLVRDVAVAQCQEPVSNTGDQDSQSETGTMVPPLQQQIELQKAALGKTSEVIDDLVDQDFVDQQQQEDYVDLSSFWNQRPMAE